MKQRKVPLRKCTGCQEMKDKKELIRIVRNDEGEFSLDRTGKKPGRGAYICDNGECLKKLMGKKLLHKTFSTDVAPEVYRGIEEESLGEK